MKLMYKKNIIFISVFIIIFFSSLTTNAKLNEDILFISSNDPSDINFYNQLNGVKDNLNEDIIVHVEYMKSGSNEKTLEEFFELIKYKKTQIENLKGLIVADDSALKFVLKFKEELFQDIPIIFFGVNDIELAYKASKIENIYGISEGLSINSNIELIEKIHSPKRIIIFNNSNNLYKNVYKDIDFAKKKYNDIVFEIINIDEIKNTDLLKKVKTLNEGDVLLVVALFDSKFKLNIDPSIITSIIESNTNIPKYSAVDYFSGKEFIGGIQLSHYFYGKSVAEMMNSILEQKLLSNFFLEEKTSNSYIHFSEANKPIFDFKNMKLFGIDKKDVPKNSFIKGYHDSFFIKNIKFFKQLLIFIILLIITILSLIFFTIRIKFYRNKLLENKKKLESCTEYKNHFVFNISHELRTPINLIITCVEFIKTSLSKECEDDISDDLKFIQKNCYKQLKVINDIIEITKVENGNNNLKLENIDIVNKIEDLIDNVNFNIEKENVRVIFDTNEEEILIALDFKKIEKVILGLISNVMKNSNEDLEIMVEIEKKDDELIIKIYDFSIETSNLKFTKNLEQFMEEHYKNNKNKDLSLYISNLFIKLHKGVLNSSDNLDKNSFIIKLPIKIIEDIDENILDVNEISISNIKLELVDI